MLGPGHAASGYWLSEVDKKEAEKGPYVVADVLPSAFDEVEIVNMGVYPAQVVKAFTASGPGQLSLRIGDVVEVQTGDNAWSLGHIVPQERGGGGGAGEDGWFPSVCIAPIPTTSDVDKGADASHVVETRPALQDGHGQYYPSVSATISASVQLSPSKEYGQFSQSKSAIKDSKDPLQWDAHNLSDDGMSSFASQYPLVLSYVSIAHVHLRSTLTQQMAGAWVPAQAGLESVRHHGRSGKGLLLARDLHPFGRGRKCVLVSGTRL